ncbi:MULTISPECIES: spore coat protein YlbD [Gracilibacillus]|uniref:Cytosolic protein n=1 Tax=Gracilibacillus dipsosauri TaxID=178340 RepID=A0A317L067_9BACI|nr:spore coat protein YlbD [Gracilibacillus dipsosauri]PWU68973.1 hypothetical protein DLJ74_11210 [Gracilibacillus dipsosauri]
MTDSLHPSVKQFKAFIKDHPELVKKVRSGESTWQELYEQFVLLGEDDPIWKENKSEHNKEESDSLHAKILKQLGQLDLDKVEKHINDLSGAINQVVGLIGQYKDYTNSSNQDVTNRPDPFAFRTRD